MMDSRNRFQSQNRGTVLDNYAATTEGAMESSIFAMFLVHVHLKQYTVSAVVALQLRCSSSHRNAVIAKLSGEA